MFDDDYETERWLAHEEAKRLEPLENHPYLKPISKDCKWCGKKTLHGNYHTYCLTVKMDLVKPERRGSDG